MPTTKKMVPTANRKPRKRRRNFTAAPISFGKFRLSQTHRQGPPAARLAAGSHNNKCVRALTATDCGSNCFHPPARLGHVVARVFFPNKAIPPHLRGAHTALQP